MRGAIWAWIILLLAALFAAGCLSAVGPHSIGVPIDTSRPDCVVNNLASLGGWDYFTVDSVRRQLGMDLRPLSELDALTIALQLNPPRSAAGLAHDAWRVCHEQS
jgi:hypothetical protein